MNDRGRLKVGLKGDFVIWDISNPYDLLYLIGHNFAHQVIKNDR